MSRAGEAVTLAALARGDPRLAHLGLIAAIFVLGPLAFSLYEHGGTFVAPYLETMAVGFSLPLVVLAALAIHRLYRLERLAERGEHFTGAVRRVVRARGAPDRVEVAYQVAGTPQLARAYRALGMIGGVIEGSKVEILVDPAAPGTAVITRIVSSY